jgi:hypothetical protein
MPRKEITIRTYKSEKRTLDKLYGKTNELFEILNEEKRRVLVKDRNLFIKNIVIFRRMMRLIQKEIILIEKIHKQLNTFINISAKETKVIKDALNELLHYQQSIFLVYDGKIEQKTNEERKERKKKVINKFNLAINELMEHYEPTNEELWDRLFPIVNALIEVENEIKRLESLVNNYKIKEKNKKIRNQNSVTETVQKIVN